MVDSLKKHKKSSNQWFYFPLYQTVINVEQTAFKKTFFRPNIIFYYFICWTWQKRIVQNMLLGFFFRLPLIVLKIIDKQSLFYWKSWLNFLMWGGMILFWLKLVILLLHLNVFFNHGRLNFLKYIWRDRKTILNWGAIEVHKCTFS